MKLLVFSLLLCGAWAQTSPPPVTDHGNHNHTEADDGVNEAHDDSVTAPAGCWQTFNGRSFKLIRSAFSWAQAQLHCLSLGGNLATIHDQKEDQFVKEVAKGKDAWIGFSDSQEDGVWLWINSKPVTFTGWCAGEPNNHHGLQHCAVINYSGKKCWDDKPCNMRRPFICEKGAQKSCGCE